MREKLTVCWMSAGVSSFISGYLARDYIDKYIYIDIDDQHFDSMRFIKDCEKVLGKEIEILKSPYGSVENAVRACGQFGIVHTGFSPCTAWLKKRIRKEWELFHSEYDITYVWGMDCTEKHRKENIIDTMIEFNHIFPLIERNITKQEAHGMCEALGVKRPAMYDLGYNNNNCIGCIKGGMGYWNKIRLDFPDVFEKRAKLERELNNRILKECFLDELEPHRGRMSDEISTDCNIFCMLNLSDESEKGGAE